MIRNIFEEALNKDSVFRNRDALSPHHVPDQLPYREEEIKELANTLTPILSGRKPENVFIYGKPGVGKTAVSKYVSRELENFARENNKPVGVIYINCRVHTTKAAVMIKIASELIPEENFMGYSTSAIYERILRRINESSLRLIIILDEVDHLKSVSDTVYILNRMNDELERGSISLIGISNDLTLKDKLDPRTKSTLCQREMVFKPYNAEELRKILEDRARDAFKEGKVSPAAIALAAAYAAKQSGDARYALQLLLRAGDVADEEGAETVTESHVDKARRIVEEDIIEEMIAALPEQEKIVLLAIAEMTLTRKGMSTITGEERILTSGDIYDSYTKLAEKLGKKPVSDRWYREYISELAMYGLIDVQVAGKGYRGNTRLIKLKFDPERTKRVIEKALME